MKNITPRRHMTFYIYAIISQIILIMIVQVECDWLVQCGQCKCKWNSGKKTADCKNQSLTGVPINLNSELQVLDLSFNQIVRIEENAFTKANLQNLHKLFIRNCSIERLHPISLRGLEILIELDLSSNLIKTLPRDAFINLVKVRSLILNQNLIEILENGVIRNLKYLHKIELKGNHIKRINIDTFQNLPYLSQIFLNDNQLKILRKEPFEKLKRLASLSLDSNPWNCTCELQIFRDFVIKRNLYTPPTSCYYPINLRGMLWNDEQLHQQNGFACKPKIIYPSRGASINTSKENVTLICRVHASPNTIIAWDYNKQIYSSLNYQARVHIQLLREESNGQILGSTSSSDRGGITSGSGGGGGGYYEKEIGRDIFISRLTIIGAEKSDEGIYTCLAENPGGKDEVQMSLLVQKHNNQDLLFQNNLIIIICLMVLGLLSASIFLAMITCCIYKRFKAMNQQHHHHHGHHHHNIGVNGSTTMDSEDSVDAQKRFHHHVVNTLVNDINVATTNSSGNLQHHNNKDSCYVEIQPQKVILNGNGHLIGSSINNFTDLNENERRYHEKSNQDSLLQNHLISNSVSTSGATPATISRTIKTLPTTENNKNKINEHHNGGEYQPDLLPYNTNTQTILFQNSNIYNGYVHGSSYDDEHQQQQRNKSTNNKISSCNNSVGQYHQFHTPDQKQIDINPATSQTSTGKLTVSMNQIYEHKTGGQLDDHHYSNNNNKYITDQTSEYLQTGFLNPTLGGRYNTLQSQPSSLPLTETINRHNPLQNGNKLLKHLNQHHEPYNDDNLHQKTSPMTSLISSSLRQLYEKNDDALDGRGKDQEEQYYREYNHHYQPRRQSIVTTSPSLNFLTTNYYPRKQLL